LAEKQKVIGGSELESGRLVSAGGVIFRTVGSEFEVALISTGSVWCLPKGLIEKNESPEQTALREVREETGLEGEIVGKIGEIHYSFSRDKRYSKIVHFYLLKYVGGSVGSHDYEADKAEWFPVSKALQYLSYVNERMILEKAVKILQEKTGL
jgi:8-oxo-dGTP pyrophosphatase MutT (NUDIX family)